MGKKDEPEEDEVVTVEVDPGPDPNSWMLSFSDMTTLLMTFFVMLISMAAMDKGKLLEVVDGFNGTLGVLGRGDATTADGQVLFTPVMPREFRVVKPDYISLGKSPDIKNVKQIHRILSGKGYSTLIRYRRVNYEDLLIIDGETLFNRGDPEIRQEAYAILNDIGEILDLEGYRTRVVAYSTEQPNPETFLEDEWDLATRRSVHIVRYFEKNGFIAPQKLSAGGYGRALDNSFFGRSHVAILYIKEDTF